MAATNAPAPRPYPQPWQTTVAVLGLLIFLVLFLLLTNRYLGEHAFIGIDGVLLLMAAGIILFSLAVVAAAQGRRARLAADHAIETARLAEQARLNEQQALDQQKHREFTLEVLSLGAAFDHLQHEALWQALQLGDAYTNLRNSDPKFYPWAGAQKLEASATRVAALFGQAVKETPIYWGAPLLYAAPAAQRVAGLRPHVGRRAAAL